DPASRPFYIVSSPPSDLLDLLAHHLCGGGNALDRFKNVFGFRRSIPVDECFKNAVLNRPLDLRSGEVLALIDELVEIEFVRIQFAFLQMDFEDLCPVLRPGQIDEVDVRKPADAELFRFELTNIVG